MSEEKKRPASLQPSPDPEPEAGKDDHDVAFSTADLERLAETAKKAILTRAATQPKELDEETAALAKSAPAGPEEAAAEGRSEVEEEREDSEARVAELEEALTQAKRNGAEFQDRLLRLHAEFDNYKKRIRRERNDLVQFANEELMKELLPFLDSFERALESQGEHELPEGYSKGMELIFNQVMSILQKNGLEPIVAIGETFDPNLHEAVMREESDELDNVVVQELRRGYRLHGKVIRQSMVSVATKRVSAPDSSREPDEEDDPEPGESPPQESVPTPAEDPEPEA